MFCSNCSSKNLNLKKGICEVCWCAVSSDSLKNQPIIDFNKKVSCTNCGSKNINFEKSSCNVCWSKVELPIYLGSTKGMVSAGTHTFSGEASLYSIPSDLYCIPNISTIYSDGPTLPVTITTSMDYAFNNDSTMTNTFSIGDETDIGHNGIIGHGTTLDVEFNGIIGHGTTLEDWKEAECFNFKLPVKAGSEGEILITQGFGRLDWFLPTDIQSVIDDISQELSNYIDEQILIQNQLSLDVANILSNGSKKIACIDKEMEDCKLELADRRKFR